MSGKVTLTVRVSEELDAWVHDEAQLQERSIGAVVEGTLRRLTASSRRHTAGNATTDGPARMSTTRIRKHVVWLCAGCEDCEPHDGSDPSRYPCDNIASANGADVFECGPVLDLLESCLPWIPASPVIHDRDGNDRANWSKTNLHNDIEALLRANGRPPVDGGQ